MWILWLLLSVNNTDPLEGGPSGYTAFKGPILHLLWSSISNGFTFIFIFHSFNGELILLAGFFFCIMVPDEQM